MGTFRPSFPSNVLGRLLVTLSLLAGALAAQCRELPLLHELGSPTNGTKGPARFTSAIPLVTFPFSLRVTNGLPLTPASIVLGATSDPLDIPLYGATLFPSRPFAMFPFLLDANGDSGPLFATPFVPAPQCGWQFVAQVIFPDPGAKGGIAFTNGLHIRFGTNTGSGPILDPVQSPTRASSVAVSGLGARPGARVLIEGGAQTMWGLLGSDRRFRVDVPLVPDKLNKLDVREEIAAGRFTPPATADVIQDRTPPEIFIDFPADRSLSPTQTTNVAGRVGDALTGFLELKVWVNDKPAIVRRNTGTNGTFELQGLMLNAENQPTIIRAVAEDGAGNRTPQPVRITVTYRKPVGARMEKVTDGDNQKGRVLQELAKPIAVVVRKPDGSFFANKVVTFEVTRSDGRLAATKSSATSSLTLQLATNGQGRAEAYWTLGSDAGCGNNRVRVTSEGIDGAAYFCASAEPATAQRILVGSGNNQVAEILGTLRAPLNVFVSDGCNGVAGVDVTFKVAGGGGGLSAGQSRNAPSVTVRTDATGHAAVAWRLGPTAGNNVVEATFDKNPGLPAVFVATAVAANAKTTSFEGIVQDNSQQPIRGATCELILGATTVRAVTDDKGALTLPDVPGTGPAHLRVDGATATHVGDQPINRFELRFPSLEYEVFVTANTANELPMPVLLPRLYPNRNERLYTGKESLELTVAGISGLKMTVAPETAIRWEGQTWGFGGQPIRLSLNQVNADDIPMPMPDGEAPPFAWTLQPSGAVFSKPVRIEYPNMTGLPSGAITCFFSFDHDAGDFRIVATGRITKDGSRAVTDPNTGIRVSGWGCQGPFGPPRGQCNNCDDPFTDGIVRAALLRSLCASKPGSGYVQGRLEKGGWIFKDAEGNYSVRDWPASCCTPCTFSLPSIPSNVAGSWHTHPNLGVVSMNHPCYDPKKPNAPWAPEPSGPDVNVVKSNPTIAPHYVVSIVGESANNEIGVKYWVIDDTGAKGFVGQTATTCRQMTAQSPGVEQVRVGEGAPFKEVFAIDERASVTINGQSVRPDRFGRFNLSNVPASRDLVRARVSQPSAAATLYGASEFFEIEPNRTFVLGPVLLTRDPPVSVTTIRATPDKRTLVMLNEATQVRVSALMSNRATIDVTPRAKGTSYRTSDDRIATVDRDGLVTAKGRGIAYITARNEGATAVTQINVALGALTTVRGFVLYDDSSPAVGADVTIPRFNLPAVKTGTGGGFEVKGVPGLLGAFHVIATITNNGKEFFAVSRTLPPVPDGITDVGILELEQVSCDFETQIGADLGLTDDIPKVAKFGGGFTFRFAGRAWDRVLVSANGNIQFGGPPDRTFNPAVPAGVINGIPRLSPAFVDFDPEQSGSVHVNQLPNRFVVTWFQVALYNNPSSRNTVQAVLFADGRIHFVYNGMTANGTQRGFRNELQDVTVAVSAGGSPQARAADYSKDPPFTMRPGEAVYENFNPSNLLDLDFSCLQFLPDSAGGYSVTLRRTRNPMASGAVWGRVERPDGAPAAGCAVRVRSSRDPRFRQELRTDASGRFHVTGVPKPGGLTFEAFDRSSEPFARAAALMLPQDRAVYPTLRAPGAARPKVP